MNHVPAWHPERRSFLARFHAGGAAIGGLILGRAASAQSKPSKAKPEPARYTPPRHPEDDWMDQVPGKHRMLFDTMTPEGAARAITFSANFLQVNEVDYGLKEAGSAIIFVVRYRSVAFGYNDTIWAKYGTAFSNQLKLEDPKTHAAPHANPHNSGPPLDNLGRAATLDSLAKLGVHFAVCNTATRNMSRSLARATGGDADALYAGLTGNLIANGRLLPPRIVGVGPAQERGYSPAHSG